MLSRTRPILRSIKPNNTAFLLTGVRNLHFTPVVRQEQLKSTTTTTNTATTTASTTTPAPEEHDASIPWYLREGESSQIDAVEIELPEIPESAPATISEFLNLIATDYGMSDIELFDLAELREDHPNTASEGSERYIIICSGKSEKHIYKAATELRHYIKSTHGILPVMEGVVSNALSAVQRRRLRKRSRRGPFATQNTFGLEGNSWVICDPNMDGIVIHMLTPQRREQLNLESLWTEIEEPELEYTPSGIDSDSIFRGIRRFHTSARQFGNEKKLKLVFKHLLEEEVGAPVTKYKQEFDENFTGETLEEHNLKYDFYKVLHLLDNQTIPEIVLLDTIWDKYASLNVQIEDIKQEITQDVIKYLELLVDCPSDWHRDPKEKFNKMGKFVSAISHFASQDLELLGNDQIQSLLWRLTYNGSNEIDGDALRELVEQEKADETLVEKDTLVQDENMRRDVLELIKQYNKDTNSEMPIWFREQMMLTFGNCGHWDAFWQEWKGIRQNITDPKDAMTYWVLLTVFIAQRNNKEAVRCFFSDYWNQDESIRSSFMSDFQKNENKFNNEKDKIAFVKAINKIKNDYSDRPWFQEPLEFAKQISK
ncbi:ATP25 [[Candida] subhashii]|uniref:ATPase synthesis protein 25 n=1 Tax=[Candida] subhashii TaxID=561895 RepID=A0A8J5QBQ0_9ASCO|nr:ATP25 [[Candida] subhashii]KAG7663479.1 ATP25 [[Candida] subhashii]